MSLLIFSKVLLSPSYFLFNCFTIWNIWIWLKYDIIIKLDNLANCEVFIFNKTIIIIYFGCFASSRIFLDNKNCTKLTISWFMFFHGLLNSVRYRYYESLLCVRNIHFFPLSDFIDSLYHVCGWRNSCKSIWYFVA